MYKKINPDMNFVSREKEILDFWKKNRIFEKTLEKTKDGEEFSFYDGPPTANGKPHIGHILTRVMKDIIPRFKTMKGYHATRIAGWDTHGLPVELEVEKQLGMDGKQDIEKYGIEPFIKKCKESVWKYKSEWEKMSDRVGYWVDMEHPYITYDDNYIESVWWSLKNIFDRGLIYKGHKIVPYCPRCGTALSSHEVAQGYKDVEEKSAAVSFKVADEADVYIVAWTTTPWTLPSNVALCVGPDFDYALVKSGDKKYIVAAERASAFFEEGEYEILSVKKGSEYVGLRYEPLYENYKGVKKSHYVVADGYVTLDEGTGIVHIAPAFGEDDARVGRDNDLPFVQMVDDRGRMTEDAPFAGTFCKDADKLILKDLKQRGLLFKELMFTHSYPFCWRCDTPLLYYARSTWFISTTKVRDLLLKNNASVNWMPESIGKGRMGNFLENVIDWGLSRERYWGTPLPIWVCGDCGEAVAIGSKAELKEKGGITGDIELHKPYVDAVTIKCPKCGKPMHRTPEVIDCWYDSGSMPFAQLHYPFENKEKFEKTFPAQFISEAVDQTRGWFYTLTVLSTALHNRPAFKNCICTGLLMAEGGQKLSKRLKNYPDPNEILETIGSDALRWFLISSPVLKGGNVAVDKEGKEIAKAARKALIPFWNAYYFFTLYANAEGIRAEEISQSDDVLDSYILAKLKALADVVRKDMAAYEIARACAEVEDFLEILNNWYIRRSRARFWDGNDMSAFNTLYTVLVNVAKIAAPLMPFMSEFVYKGLTGGESVHLEDVPTLSAIAGNDGLIAQMDMVRAISSVAKAIREEHKLRNRLPLRSMTIAGDNAGMLQDFAEALKDEVNVKNIVLKSDIADVAERFLYLKTPLIGKRLGGAMKDIMAKSKSGEWSQNEDGTLAIAGQTLFAEEYELRLVIKDGMSGQALPDNTAVVILDTTVDAELEKEGIARDFVRMIQALRKSKDFDISDRIKLAYTSDDTTVKTAIAEYADYIKEQVLALEIAENGDLSEPAVDELGGTEIRFDVVKAA